MFRTELSKSGKLTLFYNGKYIHSRYNPIAEADSFLKKQSLNKTSRLFILIGPGLGYLSSSIYNLYPNAKILSLHLDKEMYEDANKSDENWIYGEETSLAHKLSDFIPDFQLLETKIIKWNPCTNIFPDRTKTIEDIIHQFFLERRGSIYTTGYFGKTWLRNLHFNYKMNKKLLSLKIFESIIIIAASGPSLEESIELLKVNRNKYILAALPSSIAALNNYKIVPDFIFHTDPGFWAKEHLKFLSKNKTPIIMPLTAAFDSKIKNPVILFNQGSVFENILLKDNVINIPPHGTVAGTAYLFFRKITKNPIIFIGLDLCYQDVKEHVKPHSFDILFFQMQNRFNGYLNMLYKKQQLQSTNKNNIKTTNAFSIYSGWFNNKSRIKNAYRLNKSSVKTNGLEDISKLQLLSLLNNNILSSNFIINKLNFSLKDSEYRNFLNYLIEILEDFKLKINILSEDSILEYFTKSNLLTEVFQFTAYSEILELSHFYRNDLTKSRAIIYKIYSKSFQYINLLLERDLYGNK